MYIYDIKVLKLGVKIFKKGSNSTLKESHGDFLM